MIYRRSSAFRSFWVEIGCRIEVTNRWVWNLSASRPRLGGITAILRASRDRGYPPLVNRPKHINFESPNKMLFEKFQQWRSDGDRDFAFTTSQLKGHFGLEWRGWLGLYVPMNSIWADSNITGAYLMEIAVFVLAVGLGVNAYEKRSWAIRGGEDLPCLPLANSPAGESGFEEQPCAHISNSFFP